MDENSLSNLIINRAIKVHQTMGPGVTGIFLSRMPFYELVKAGLTVEKEKGLPLVYESVKLDYGYRVDLLVEKKVIIGVKALEYLNDVHLAQILTYLNNRSVNSGY